LAARLPAKLKVASEILIILIVLLNIENTTQATNVEDDKRFSKS